MKINTMLDVENLFLEELKVFEGKKINKELSKEIVSTLDKLIEKLNIECNDFNKNLVFSCYSIISDLIAISIKHKTIKNLVPANRVTNDVFSIFIKKDNEGIKEISIISNTNDELKNCKLEIFFKVSSHVLLNRQKKLNDELIDKNNKQIRKLEESNKELEEQTEIINKELRSIK